MRISDLIKKFSVLEAVPVPVSGVDAIIRENKAGHVIMYHEVELDTKLLRGQFTQWESKNSDGEVIHYVDIFFGKDLEKDWQRLVCCKELLHLLDADVTKVATLEQFDKLIEKIILPADLQDPINDGHHVDSDRIAIYEAVAILFPIAVRTLLLQADSKSKYTVQEIARIVDLPVRYVSLVMSDLWPDIHKILIS
jgi:hypothetical protein